jgi:hypothetical protein
MESLQEFFNEAAAIPTEFGAKGGFAWIIR